MVCAALRGCGLANWRANPRPPSAGAGASGFSRGARPAAGAQSALWSAATVFRVAGSGSPVFRFPRGEFRSGSMVCRLWGAGPQSRLVDAARDGGGERCFAGLASSALTAYTWKFGMAGCWLVHRPCTGSAVCLVLSAIVSRCARAALTSTAQSRYEYRGASWLTWTPL